MPTYSNSSRRLSVIHRTTAPQEPPKGHNKLNSRQLYNLTNWLSDNWEDLVVGQKYHKRELAKTATLHLEFPVTLANITNAHKTLGISWPFGRGPAASHSTEENPLNELRRDLSFLTSIVAHALLDPPGAPIHSHATQLLKKYQHLQASDSDLLPPHGDTAE